MTGRSLLSSESIWFCNLACRPSSVALIAWSSHRLSVSIVISTHGKRGCLPACGKTQRPVAGTVYPQTRTLLCHFFFSASSTLPTANSLPSSNQIAAMEGSIASPQKHVARVAADPFVFFHAFVFAQQSLRDSLVTIYSTRHTTYDIFSSASWVRIRTEIRTRSLATI